MQIEFDAAKFRELLLYIANRSLSDPHFGATKLNKILFFSDFYAYGMLGRPITGAEYQRLEYGPAPRQLKPTVEQMRDAQEATVLPRRHFNRQQQILFPLRDPDLSRFTAEEIALVDEVIRLLQPYNVTQVSELSHGYAVGWQVARENETIPYQTVFLSSEPLTVSDIRRGQELAQKYGLVEPL